MRRSTVSISAAVAMIAGACCSATHAVPLAPGKPAGVRAAQLADKDILVLGGLGVLAAAVLIANAGGDGHDAVATQPITIVTPTTT